MSDAVFKQWNVDGSVMIESGYWSPEWVRLMLDVKSVATKLTTAALWGASLSWLWAQDLSAGEKTVAACALLAVSYGASWSINNAMLNFKGGYALRPHGNQSLKVRIGKKAIGIEEAPGHWEIYPRCDTTSFFIEQSPLAKTEERDERRVERHLPFIYRDSWNIVLQTGECFTVLASVASAEHAKAIVRRLQNIDEFVTRGEAAAPGSSAFGRRSNPE